MNESNWAGNYTYKAGTLHRPSSLEQVQETIANARSIGVLGSRHSFTDIADSAELLALDGLPPDVAVDHAAGTVTLSGGVKYGELANILKTEGVALPNLASLPHISVAGAVATASHGSGDANGNLATSVRALEFVTSSGEMYEASKGDADFGGLVVSLGALGALTRLTLEVEPTYHVRQRVFERLGWDALFANFDQITSAGTSVSVFTRWSDEIDQAWVKSRVTDASESLRDDLFGAVPATVDRHPILGLDPVSCTPQLGVEGLWSDRLPHFRMGFTPSSGQELQSEYMVPRRHAIAAIQAVQELSQVIRPVLQVSEIRTVAADGLWMSPQYGQDTVAIHFTWEPDQDAVERVLIDIEDTLARFEARPHWGKVFLAEAASIAPLYKRLPDFIRLANQLDPRGAFRNEWLNARVFGDRA